MDRTILSLRHPGRSAPAGLRAATAVSVGDPNEVPAARGRGVHAGHCCRIVHRAADSAVGSPDAADGTAAAVRSPLPCPCRLPLRRRRFPHLPPSRRRFPVRVRRRTLRPPRRRASAGHRDTGSIPCSDLASAGCEDDVLGRAAADVCVRSCCVAGNNVISVRGPGDAAPNGRTPAVRGVRCRAARATADRGHSSGDPGRIPHACSESRPVVARGAAHRASTGRCHLGPSC